MKLKFLFVVMAVLQLSVWGILLGFGIDTRTTVFYVIEGLTLLNVVFLIFFYSRLMRPIDSLANGLDLLKAQDWNTRLRPVGQPDVDRIVDTFNDMLERLKQQRIRYEERTHFIDLLIHAAPIGVVILDYSGHEAVVNPAAQAMVGQSAGLETFLGGLALGETADFNTASGDTLRCSCHSFIDRGVEHRFYLMENISNSIAAAERAAYEKVIRIIAHEVNNTMAGVKSILETLSSILEEQDLVEAIDSCNDRCGSMSEFITAYADVVKIPQAKLQTMDIANRIASLMPFLEGLAGSSATVRLTVSTSAPPLAMIDPVLFEQTIVNIVKNSKESIESTGRHGNITITVTDSPVAVTVTDNGAGITPEASGHIFSPFFSTKRGGQGLGLMMVGDILRKHGCRFSLRTDNRSGLTSFKIDFPNANQALTASAGQAIPSSDASAFSSDALG